MNELLALADRAVKKIVRGAQSRSKKAVPSPISVVCFRHGPTGRDTRESKGCHPKSSGRIAQGCR